jgi:hypothetical protein
MSKDQIGSDLPDWEEYATSETWQGILVGNGASRAVWEDFKYDSLFSVAKSEDIADKLTHDDEQIFAKLGDTRNFEAVLGALLTTSAVCKVLSLPNTKVDERYISIQKALIAAVHKVHVPWSLLSNPSLISIGDALREYEFIFSTNYDLLLYWAIMAHNGVGFRDFFWSSLFDVANTEVWDKTATKVLYLHGALHLRYSTDGGTYKEQAGEFTNLLDLFGKHVDSVPLCITEGTARQKLAAITRSDYLSFALQQFGQETGPLVIFGHSLGPTDRHLADILSRGAERTFAIGIYPSDPKQVIREKAHFQKTLAGATLLYFNSTTHPLGSTSLRVPQP